VRSRRRGGRSYAEGCDLGASHLDLDFDLDLVLDLDLDRFMAAATGEGGT
jgi:hypothetical protein